MANTLFLIAAGGTGAKVVESFLHLCAAGFGPDEPFNEAQILLVDGDKSNRAFVRACALAQLYKEMHEWPWQASGTVDMGKEASHLFKMRIQFYTLDQRLLAGAANQSLHTQLAGDSELAKAMSILLRQSELKAVLDEGFLGCPNIGSMIVSKYLTDFMTRGDGEAAIFTRELKKVLAAKERHAPCVITVGSIFGGTGASIAPVVKTVLTKLLEKEFSEKLKWGSVMTLPYFTVDETVNTGRTSPKRQPLDALFALAYYKAKYSHSPHAAYLIGSENRLARRRRVWYSAGGPSQYSPPFFQDLLAAFAILDLWRDPEVKEEGGTPQPVRHYGGAGGIETNSLANLPDILGSADQERIKTRLARLLHLGAFYLRRHGGSDGDFRKGLYQYAVEANVTGWHQELQRLFARSKGDLTAGGSEGRTALEYFGRLLFWAASVFDADRLESDREVPGAVGLRLSGGDYVPIHNAMCSIEKDGALHYNSRLTGHICCLAANALNRNSFPLFSDDKHETIGLFMDGLSMRKSVASALELHRVTNAREICEAYDSHPREAYDGNGRLDPALVEGLIRNSAATR